jgi:hypothetical protein
MTTERFAWYSANPPVSSAAMSPPPICGCGQELDGGPRRHCTRCGSRWPGASDLFPSRCESS